MIPIMKNRKNKLKLNAKKNKITKILIKMKNGTKNIYPITTPMPEKPTKCLDLMPTNFKALSTNLSSIS